MSDIWVQIQDLDDVVDEIARTKRVDLDPEKLKKKLEGFVKEIGKVLNQLPDATGQYPLAAITLSVGISTGFELGIVTGASASISLTFQKE